jgi:hypothetical protein
VTRRLGDTAVRGTSSTTTASSSPPVLNRICAAAVPSSRSALHLYGARGMLALLREDGWQVRPIR